jgi:hypothetical protein
MTLEPYVLTLVHLGKGILVPPDQDLFDLRIQRYGGMFTSETEVSLRYGLGSLSSVMEGLTYCCHADPPLFQDFFLFHADKKTREVVGESLMRDIGQLVELHNRHYEIPLMAEH